MTSRRDITEAAAALGRRGGESKSAAKARANRLKAWARWHPGQPYPGDPAAGMGGRKGTRK